MKTRVSLYVIAMGAILALTVGCVKSAPNDAQIASDIQSKLNADSGLQGKQLGVQSAGGTVTLSGSVDNDIQREAAARYASSVPGVKQVVNNLVGRRPGTPTGSSANAATTAGKACPRSQTSRASTPPEARGKHGPYPCAGTDGRGSATTSGRCYACASSTTAAAREGHNSFRHHAGGASGGYD